MKAFLLAAGYGTRLKPLTDSIPKCLVPINNQPLLSWWIKLLKKHHISEVLINTHYHNEQVSNYVKGISQTNIKIKIIYEKELLGSGGTIKNNANFVCDETEFLICYADNLTCVDLSKLIHFHNNHSDILTMGLFHANNPTQCGIAMINTENIITEFIEKPLKPRSNLANAGIYVASNKIFDYFPPNKAIFDLGHDILPLLSNKMRGHIIHEYLLDIGTIENYKKANEDWKNDYISNPT